MEFQKGDLHVLWNFLFMLLLLMKPTSPYVNFINHYIGVIVLCWCKLGKLKETIISIFWKLQKSETAWRYHKNMTGATVQRKKCNKTDPLIPKKCLEEHYISSNLFELSLQQYLNLNFNRKGNLKAWKTWRQWFYWFTVRLAELYFQEKIVLGSLCITSFLSPVYIFVLTSHTDHSLAGFNNLEPWPFSSKLFLYFLTVFWHLLLERKLQVKLNFIVLPLNIIWSFLFWYLHDSLFLRYKISPGYFKY